MERLVSTFPSAVGEPRAREEKFGKEGLTLDHVLLLPVAAQVAQGEAVGLRRDVAPAPSTVAIEAREAADLARFTPREISDGIMPIAVDVDQLEGRL